MTNRLILIEGMPASGKSTVMRRMGAELAHGGQTIRLYKEHNLDGVDTSCQAILQMPEYRRLRDDYRSVVLRASLPKEKRVEMLNLFDLYSRAVEDNMLVAYAMLYEKVPPKVKIDGLIQRLYDKDFANGAVSSEEYMRITSLLWEQFAQNNRNSQVISIFEGALIQNPLIALLGNHCLSEERIVSYLLTLLKAVEILRPKLYYISAHDVPAVLRNATQSRISESGHWIDGFIHWIEHSRYAAVRSISGYEAVLAFCEACQVFGLRFIEACPCEVETIVR